MQSVEESSASCPQTLKCTGVVLKYHRLRKYGSITAVIDDSERKIEVKRAAIVTRPARLEKGQHVSFEIALPVGEKPEALNVSVLYGDGVANLNDMSETEDPEFDAVVLHSRESLSLIDVIKRDRSELARNDRNETANSSAGASSADSMLSTGSHISVEETAIHMNSNVRFVVEENDELDIVTVEQT